ncbi:hypothetical protein LKL35_05620 [Streptomyces sp. ET3-23]|uniref:hypothetical protein n=1 Tax=Streptomyces sp. ET3-23 TaxID=2885643 RepID=UPI001D1272C1|nr:hypothetical protein [Streptomyces sp. ET3-23]MCC2274915.1 hypothetical protein [Streptomyces sp. ET3-23]
MAVGLYDQAHEQAGVLIECVQEGQVLSPEELETPLADVPSKARPAGISMWITAGVEPPEAARRAGHSLAVLYRVYAKILRGRAAHANALIAKALQEEDIEST